MIRDAIQKLLDVYDEEGWHVTQHCVVMGLERVVDGRIEAVAWHWFPPDQPEWMTTALLQEALKQREECEYDDE